jgi:nitrous-oxide reductase
MIHRFRLVTLAALAALAIGALLALASCGDDDDDGGNGGNGTSNGELDAIAQERGLTPEDMKHALQQFVPPGKYDEYVMFASGGHGGQVIAVGMPSMRILKVIAVFTPEPWQGYGFGADWGDTVLAEGNPTIPESSDLTWGDVHHPAISETSGEYDGRWLYVNDRANGRLGMVDLADWRTKQVVAVPNLATSHGGMFVTPNSEYVHISTKFPSVWPPAADAYADLDQYQEKFRGVSAWMKIDQETGKIDLDESFQIEIPPYNQDLADAGKKVSDGWGFIGSWNTEMAVGGNSEGGESLEAGASQNNFDYLHVINWKKAAEVAETKAEELNGIRVIDLETAVAEGLLYLIPEPKSPHGADVDPSGRYIVVGGKLDPHVTIYDFNKIQEAIAAKDYEGTDPFGVPILKFESVMAGQVEVGAGPLHTQFDSQGHGYTSMFLANAIAKFTLGEDVVKVEGEEPFTLIETVQIHYNIGHLATAEGDTVSPDDNYMVALNKWSIDRYAPQGPLHPQNFQLIDLKGGRGPLDLIADMPIGMGEPHYAQIIKADKLKSLEYYPSGTDALTGEKSEYAIEAGQEKVERNGTTVEVWATATRSHFTPDIIRVKKGDTVKLHITNVEQTRDATHGFALGSHNIQASLEPGETSNFEFVADKAGAWNFYCTEFCSALHLEMAGWLLVEP